MKWFDTISIYFNWFIGFVPGWVLPIIIAVALLTTAQFWLPIWTVLPSKAKAAIGIVAGALAIFGFGRYKGAKSERDKRALDNSKAIERKAEIHNEVESLDDKSVDDRLSRNGWMRDD